MKYVKSSYNDNGTLAVLAYNKSGLYGVVTVNIYGSERLPDGCQFVDENNWPGIAEKLEKEGIAKKLKDRFGDVIMGHSGFCTYTAMKFDMSKLTEVKNG